MEKGPKPKIESPQKPEEPEIETWESEGGSVEVEKNDGSVAKKEKLKKAEKHKNKILTKL